MLTYLVNNITLERLEEDEKKVIVDKGSSDFISYAEFIKYFENISALSKHNLIIGINFTYGWMPTIFNFKSNQLDEALPILNAAKNGLRPKAYELDLLKKCFNNSLVGTSKLLHFINPNMFAIWDSRIYRYLKNEEPHKYRLENSKSYIDYLTFCDTIINHPEYSKIHSSLENKIGYSMTKHRTIDLLMFLNGGNEKSRKL